MATEDAQRHYRGESGERYQQSKRGVPERALPWVARARARKFSQYVGARDVVLEYGAGLGWNLVELRCRRKVAFDLENFIGPAARDSGVEFAGDLKAIREGSVDVVICHHALEHVMLPSVALEEMRGILKLQGKLLLFVPHEREGRYLRFDRDEPNHHLYSWNVQTLGNLVEESGFRVAEAGIGAFGYDRFAAVWADKLRAGESGFKWIRGLLRLLKPVHEVRVVASRS